MDLFILLNAHLHFTMRQLSLFSSKNAKIPAIGVENRQPGLKTF